MIDNNSGDYMKTIEIKDDSVIILDQTLLPGEVKYIECGDIECIAQAIIRLSIRGAPALGIAGAFSLALTALQNPKSGREEIIGKLKETYEHIKKTRPTAVNLVWAMDRIMGKLESSKNIQETVFKEAMRIYEEDFRINKKMGDFGSEIIDDGDTILTHCNAGGLATGGYGTALGVIVSAKNKGKNVKVFADETRPLLQGDRLTAFEMVREDIPVTVITDSMAAFSMKNFDIKKVVVGADRIAANGDTANKIGTYGVAILAKEHGIPFYVAAPLSTIDRNTPTGEDIPIEFRNREEIEFFNGKRVVPTDAEIKNPAFDVTPAKYITGIITEMGILKAPFIKNIKKAFEEKEG